MKCEVEIPSETPYGQKYDRAELTVGREFYFQCQGDFSKADLSDEGAGSQSFKLLQPDPEDQFSLKILDLRKNSDEAITLTVTSYRPGSITVPEFSFQIGETIHKSEVPLQFQVASLVQEESQKGVKVEPYGAFGPLVMVWPLWLWIGIALLMALIFGGAGYAIFKKRQRRKLLAKTSFQASLDPLIEFEKKIRQMQNVHEANLTEKLSDLDTAWRIYWTRKFQFPALYWSELRLLQEFRLKHPSYDKEQQKNLENFLSEMKKVRKNEIKPNLHEFDQLLRRCRQTIESIDHHMESGHSKERSRV